MDKKLFAIPTINGKLSGHFGRCEKFAIVEVEDEKIVNEYYLDSPEHQPGVYPRFLADNGVNTIIARGMGPKAHQLFAENNIEVFIGVSTEEPQKLVENCLNDELKTGENLCENLEE